MAQTIECRFNIFNEGRKYTGHHRQYVLENAQDICLSEKTRERVRLREALGYYGHGRRIIAGKMNLSEVEAVKMPDGSTVLLSNVPSNVTTVLDVAGDGTVTHSQEILDSETGKIVAGLHGSRVGGFSWACPGTDGGRLGVTKLSGFAGFDYVLDPGFAHNRGYILESAEGEEISMDAIMESVAKTTGIDNAKAEGLVRGWAADACFQAMELEAALERQAIYESALLEKLSGRQVEFEALSAKYRTAVEAQEAEMAHRQTLVDTIVKSSSFFIPEDVKHAMMENDFEKVAEVFEKARAIDLSQVPLPDSARPGKGGGEHPAGSNRRDQPAEYGTPAAAWDLS